MKKLCRILLSLALLLSVTGCADKSGLPGDAATPSPYIISRWAALNDSVSAVSRVLRAGDGLLLCCTEEDENENTTSYAASMRIDGGGFKKLPLATGKGEKLLDIAQAGQGGLWALIEAGFSETEAVYSLRRFKINGEQAVPAGEITINAFLEKAGALHPYADMALKADAAGRLCLSVYYGISRCLFFDEEGVFLFYLEDPGSSAKVITTAGGDFALSSRQNWDYSLRPVDMARQSWGGSRELKTVSGIYDGAGEADFYLYDSSALYAYPGGDGEAQLLFRWADLGLSSGNTHVLPLGEGRFAVLSSNFSQTGISAYEYCVVEPGEDERTVLDMLSLRPDYALLDAVAQFNKSSRQYKVELRSVFPADEDVSKDDWDRALMKLNTRLISGEIPDIIDLNHLPARDYMRRGFLEDLLPYIKADPLIQKEDYFDHVFEALSMDGKLPYVTSNVLVLTMFADSGLVGGAESWTVEDFARLLESSPAAFESAPAGWFLDRVLRSDMGFVDRDSGECRFESGEFTALLELSKALEEGAKATGPESGEDIACCFVNAASVFDLARCSALIGGEAVPIGYPGRGTPAHVLSPANRVGISAAGEHKEGAWEFARSLLEARAQESGGFFPIRKASFEKIAAEAAKGRSMWAGQLYYGEIGKEDIDLTRKVLNEARFALDSSDGLTELVVSGAEAYFNGTKTAGQAAADIQKRASLYLSEHK